MRVGLTKIRVKTNSELGTNAAEAAKNAAVDGSPGTVKSKGERGEVILETVAASPSVERFAPSPDNIFSVWSRDKIGSVTDVSPLAPSPAKRTADFTWALATGDLYRIPFKSLLQIVIGNLPSLLSDFNPI